MRLPQRPPVVRGAELADAIDATSRPEVLAVIKHANAAYFHWDELRARPMPPGFTARQAWGVLKLTRRAERRGIPLVDGRGRSFSYWLPPAALEILHEVDRWAGGALAMSGPASSSLQPLRDEVVVSSLMEEAIASSQIEGAATTRRVAKEMLRSNRRPRGRGEQMIANGYETIQFLRAAKDEPLSLELLFEIQSRMTRGTLDDPSGAGRLRVEADRVSVIDVRSDTVLFTPPVASELPKRLEKLIAYANAPSSGEAFIHPLVKAAVLHFWLAYEHAFVDGNGRTARAVFFWFMLKNGYWLFEYLTVSRAILKSPAGYYRSFLYSEHDDEDVTYSLLYQLDATKRALADLRSYLEVKQAERALLPERLRAIPDANPRQRSLLDHALRNPDSLITFAGHARTHDVTLVTARRDVLELFSRKLLREVGKERPRTFLPVPGLDAKLSSARRNRG